MKTSKIIFAFLLAVSTLSKGLANGIDFEHGTWAEVQAKAKAEDKIIFVDAYATWCGPCKRMAQTTFIDDKVGDFFNSSFINFKLDMESEEGIMFDDVYHVKAYPTLLFINGDGEMVKSVTGAKDANDFLELGRGVLYPEETDLFKFKQKYAKGVRDTAFLYDFIIELHEADEDWDKPMDDYFSQLQLTDLIKDKPFIVFYLSSLTDLSNIRTKYFTENYAEFEAYYGEYAAQKALEILDVNTKLAGANNSEEMLEHVLILARNMFPDNDELQEGIVELYQES